MPAFDWLDETHEVYDACADEWARAERLLRGGSDVMDELARFDWETPAPSATAGRDLGAVVVDRTSVLVPAGETSAEPPPIWKPGEHYRSRQRQATYLNFPQMFAEEIIGHLMQKAPSEDAGLSFGVLGTVKRAPGQSQPSRAELLYYNTDGVGNDGSQWDAWWSGVDKRAMATGHRWIYVEAPRERPQTFADEIAGRRPYLVEYSPLAVTNWHYEGGVLQWAVIRIARRRPRVVDGRLDGTTKKFYLLLVRAGVEDLNDGGMDFSAGGWWVFDDEKLPTEERGDWSRTSGAVPLFAHYYERDGGTDDLPRMSRPALHEIGNAAVAFMNLASACNFELWDGAKGMTFLRGIDREGWNLAMEKIAAGSRYVPLTNYSAEGVTPEAAEQSPGVTVAAGFNARLQAIRDEVKEMAVREVTSTPDSSGVSKRVGFSEGKSPRLRLMASEKEQSQNTALYFLERRWVDAEPTAVVRWPRDFELKDVILRLTEFFTLEELSGYRSPTIGARGMTAAAVEMGLVSDDAEKATVEAEYLQAAQDREKAAADAAARLRDIDEGEGGPPFGA